MKSALSLLYLPLALSFGGLREPSSAPSKCLEPRLDVSAEPLVAREMWEAGVELLHQGLEGSTHAGNVAATASTAPAAGSFARTRRPRQHCLLDALYRLPPSLLRAAIDRTNKTALCDRLDDEALLPQRGFVVTRGALGPKAFHEALEAVAPLPVTRVEAGGRQYSDSFSLRARGVLAALNGLIARWDGAGLLATPPRRDARENATPPAGESVQMRVSSALYVSVDPVSADGSRLNWHVDASQEGTRAHKFWVLLHKAEAAEAAAHSNVVVLPSTGIDAVGATAARMLEARVRAAAGVPPPPPSSPAGPMLSDSCQPKCVRPCCELRGSSACSGCDARAGCHPAAKCFRDEPSPPTEPPAATWMAQYEEIEKRATRVSLWDALLEGVGCPLELTPGDALFFAEDVYHRTQDLLHTRGALLVTVPMLTVLGRPDQGWDGVKGLVY